MGSKFLGHKKYRINSCNFLQRTNKKKSRSTVEPPLKATSPQWPFFLAYSPYIDSSVAKVAVVERFNGNFFFFLLSVFTVQSQAAIYSISHSDP